jgi:hypothetical protein
MERVWLVGLGVAWRGGALLGSLLRSLAGGRGQGSCGV